MPESVFMMTSGRDRMLNRIGIRALFDLPSYITGFDSPTDLRSSGGQFRTPACAIEDKMRKYILSINCISAEQPLGSGWQGERCALATAHLLQRKQQTHNTMRAYKKIGGAMLTAGLAVAVCTPDGCKNEIAWRLAGVVLLVVGGLVAKEFDFQGDEREDEEEERRVDRDPYPEETLKTTVNE
jgi:hypothetical protein